MSQKNCAYITLTIVTAYKIFPMLVQASVIYFYPIFRHYLRYFVIICNTKPWLYKESANRDKKKLETVPRNIREI